MIKRRIIYALIGVSAFIAFIWTESAVALFMFILAAAMPLCSYACLFVAAKRINFDCDVRAACMRGSALGITVKIGVSPRFLLGRAEVKANIENTTFSKTEKKIFVFDDLSFSPKTYDYVGADSGRVRVHIEKIRLVDFLGVFSLSIKRNDKFESIVSPVLYDGLQVLHGDSGNYMSIGERVDVAKKGGDRSETIDVRDYMPGDSLNSVHWKLSSKFDSLMTREYGRTSDYKIFILVDLSRKKYDREATDRELNGVLDIAVSLSDSFRTGGIMHCVGWVDSGAIKYSEVCDNDTFIRMTNALMSAKVTETDAKAAFCFASDEAAGSFTKCILVSEEARDAELRRLPCDAIAISVGKIDGEFVAGGFRMIDVDPEHIGSTLSTFTV